MKNRVAELKAELLAIALWDRLYSQLEHPGEIDKDACAARFRRRQVIEEKLKELSANDSRLEQSREQIIAELEMLATAIGAQAERVGRPAFASRRFPWAGNCWAISMDLDEKAKAARTQAAAPCDSAGKFVKTMRQS